MTSILGGQINLPPLILIHATGLLLIGLRLTFSPNKSVLGIATVGLGLGYLLTAHMPIEQNVFLHATVPARLVLASLAGVRALSAPKAERGTLWGILIYDGLGGLGLGWWLGRWNGRIAA